MQLLQIRERIRLALAALADSGTCVEVGYVLGDAQYEPYAELLVVIDGRRYNLGISEVGDDE
jgi:hypothetical protein